MAESPGRNADQAALLGVALAATVTISVEDGQWEPIESIVGIVLLTIVRAYYDLSPAHLGTQTRARLVALASVAGLCCCLVLAYPAQRAGINTFWALPFFWIGLAAGFFVWLWRRHGRIPSGQAENAQDAEQPR